MFNRKVALKKEKHRAGLESDSGIFKYGYDQLNRLIEAVTPQATRQYAYDPLGNRTSSKIIKDGIMTDTRHSYNERNQLMRTETGGDITEYGYDRRGNLVKETLNGKLQMSYEYDATNMMAAVYAQGLGLVEHMYNGFCNRVGKTEKFFEPLHGFEASNRHIANDADSIGPCNSERYTLDMTLPHNNLLISEILGEKNHKQSFVWGNELLSGKQAMENNDTGMDAFHYLYDHLGSPIRLFDSVGIMK